MISKAKLIEMASSILPDSIQEGMISKPIASGLAAISFIMALPVLGGVGAISAVGWYVVYGVCLGSFSKELSHTVYKSYRSLKNDERKDIQEKLDILKSARNNGQINDDEYKASAKMLLDKVIKKNDKENEA